MEEHKKSNLSKVCPWYRSHEGTNSRFFSRKRFKAKLCRILDRTLSWWRRLV